MKRAGAVVAALLCAGAVQAAEVSEISTPAPVERIIAEAGAALVATTDGLAYRLQSCPDVVCLEPADHPPSSADVEPDRLPDGGVAEASEGDIRRARYVRPTRRYDHAVLGDDIEAGGVAIETGDGRRIEYVLPETHVFEDLTPRIADLDADGRNEIVAIRSSLAKGSAIAVLGLRDAALTLLDASPEIGKRHRWLNIAGIADYTGAGVPVIAWVETPHIGGTLRMAAFADGKLDVFANSYEGFSNHAIGSRELGLAATADFTGDGVPDLALPAADRRSIVIAARTGFETIPLPGRIAHRVVAVSGTIVTATDAGTLLAIRP